MTKMIKVKFLIGGILKNNAHNFELNKIN